MSTETFTLLRKKNDRTKSVEKAKVAAFEMAKLSADAKNTALCRMANALEANAEKILAANKIDVEAAKAKRHQSFAS